MIIDATDLILGRLASYTAKKALLGEKLDIINSEKSVISGKKKQIYNNSLRKRQRGIPLQGPYYPRQPDALVRRTIRGMIPYKTDRGKKAFKNIHCWVGVPPKLKDKKAETIKQAAASKLPYLKYTAVGNICKLMGSK
ncbi:50S ribosomal protein L13 [Candidatus Woesearchaeota archaeon]|nr:50S ribosomal protein L13 [Candidatus Woesearchaeota archaeon]